MDLLWLRLISRTWDTVWNTLNRVNLEHLIYIYIKPERETARGRLFFGVFENTDKIGQGSLLRCETRFENLFSQFCLLRCETAIPFSFCFSDIYIYPNCVHGIRVDSLPLLKAGRHRVSLRCICKIDQGVADGHLPYAVFVACCLA